jgi:hypothetical protein
MGGGSPTGSMMDARGLEPERPKRCDTGDTA